MSLAIRPAAPADAALVLSFIRELAEYERLAHEVVATDGDIAAALFGPDLYLLMVVIGLTGWTGDARFIRAEFLRLRNQDFVQAATAAGLPLRSVLFRHMLPNGITPVLVSTSFGVASAILLESTLSFLGLGDPDRPSWGQLLNQARSAGAAITWWIALFPGLAIFLTVFGYNLIGEALRDALDPKLLKRE